MKINIIALFVVVAVASCVGASLQQRCAEKADKISEARRTVLAGKSLGAKEGCNPSDEKGNNKG